MTAPILTYTRTEPCGPGSAASFRCRTSYSVFNHEPVICSAIPPTLICAKPGRFYAIERFGFCCREMAEDHPLHGTMPRFYTFDIELAEDKGFGPYCDYVGGTVLLEYNEHGARDSFSGNYIPAWVSKPVQVGDAWYWWLFTCRDLQGDTGGNCAGNDSGEDICLVSSATSEYGTGTCVLFYNWTSANPDNDDDPDTQNIDCWSPTPRRYSFAGANCPDPEVYKRCVTQQKFIYKYPVFPPT